MPTEPPPHPSRLRPLHRPEGSVQLGVGPRSVRFLGLTPAEVRWLAATETTRPLADARARAGLEDIDPHRAEEVLERLVTAGLLTPEPAASSVVAVVGHGTLPALLVDVLRQDEGNRAVRVRPGGERETSVALAVVVGAGPVDPTATTPWLATGTPVLPVWCQPDQASIGPVLTAEGRPCLQCLELTRTAYDPGWPWLRAQLTRVGVSAPEPVDGHPALRLLTAGLTTARCLDLLSGRLEGPDWSFEIALPGPTLERHRWRPHPECSDCRASPAAVPTTPGAGASSVHTDWPDTMAG